MTCPTCGSGDRFRVLYMGAPGHYCDGCQALTGPASWLAAVWWDGCLVEVEPGASMWRAFWVWLQGGF